MRVLSMAMIMLFHTSQLTGKEIASYQNIQDIELTPWAAERNPGLQFVLFAQNAVDTFFFLGGFLLAFLSVPEFRKGKFKILRSIILRYVRLTPSFALVLLVYWKVWPHMGNGPFSSVLQDTADRCDGSWWTALTYTMNFYPFSPKRMCMGWTW